MSPHLATRAASETGDPLLLTPGPLTTSRRVKQAMVHDWGSRDAAFVGINQTVLARLPEIVNGEGDYVTVPMQGSGTFAVEAMLTTFVPPRRQGAVLINGAYGQRAKRILEIARRAVRGARDAGGHAAGSRRRSKRILTRDRQRSRHVFAVHCETTSGILNPIEEIAALVAARYGKRLLIDAMSAFGALRSTRAQSTFDAVAASSNKCIEGVPGLGFVICRREALAAAKGNATTLVLDLLRPVARTSRRPASTASRRRSTSSSPSIRRCGSSRPRAASPAAAGATRRTAAC